MLRKVYKKKKMLKGVPENEEVRLFSEKVNMLLKVLNPIFCTAFNAIHNAVKSYF